MQDTRDAETLSVRFKLRIAMTFREGDTICPFFDSTELSVNVSPTDIRFTNEEEWAGWTAYHGRQPQQAHVALGFGVGSTLLRFFRGPEVSKPHEM